MKSIEKFSLGIGDRFGLQGQAQLQALVQAREAGVTVSPVWNKSHREHSLIGTTQAAVRREADEAVSALSWDGAYYVDADHIGLDTVDAFIAESDFFTLDVADFTGKRCSRDEITAFVSRHSRLLSDLDIPGIEPRIELTREMLMTAAEKYLLAVKEAGRIYRRVVEARGADDFVTEVSMDETDAPQTPADMLTILAAIADEGIPAQTIAPKFTGRFNKGVDYVGDLQAFAREFEQDLLVTRYAVREFALPLNLKLSVHSGSDKFSLYGIVREAIDKHGMGLHLKTAGTTWLEEITGLAAAGGEALDLAGTVYRNACDRFGELCGPYASVLDIDTATLPTPDTVDGWSSEEFVAAVAHDPDNPRYNAGFRQLMHVAYKVAAEMGDTFLQAVRDNESSIAGRVTENLFERHVKPLFLGA